MSSYVPLKLDPVPEILNSIEDQLFRNKAEKILEIIDKEQVRYINNDFFIQLSQVNLCCTEWEEKDIAND